MCLYFKNQYFPYLLPPSFYSPFLLGVSLICVSYLQLFISMGSKEDPHISLFWFMYNWEQGGKKQETEWAVAEEEEGNWCRKGIQQATLQLFIDTPPQ